MEKILSSAMAVEEMNKTIAKRNELASQIVEKREQFDNADVEVREQIISEIEDLNKEVEEMDNQVKELEEVKDTLEEQEERMSLMNNVSTEKVEARKIVVAQENDEHDTPEYRKAVANYIKTGILDTRATDVAFTTSDATPVLPIIMQKEIETAWEEDENIVDLCSISNVSSIFAVPVEISATGAVWHTEGSGAVDSEEITLGQLLLQPQFIKKYLPITDEVLLMSDDEFLRYVAREMTHRVKEQLNTSIISRDASLGVVGILKAVSVNIAPEDDDAVYLGETLTQALDFNTGNAATALLKTYDNLTVVMNPATFFNSVMGLKDTTGRPIYQIMQDNTGKAQYYYNGLKVKFSSALKAYSAASNNDPYMIVGNFKGYKLNLPQGKNVSILRDPYTKATEDVERFIAKLPAAGNITKLGHFVVVKKAAA